jgi:hypothetical protein
MQGDGVPFENKTHQAMKLTITRLRSGANYKGIPLLDIMDSFYELYSRFIEDHPEFDYGVCNFGWNKANRRTLDDIVDSDVLLIPSEQEFQWHIKGYRDQREKLRTDDFVSAIGRTLKNKHIILLRSDRADDEHLYRQMVFKGLPIGKFSVLDEMDIEGGIHGMKFHFIQEICKPQPKRVDFIYWGCDKRRNSSNEVSGDVRHEVFKTLQRDGTITTYFIGKYSTVRADERIQPMRDLVPRLATGRATLCFNWMDPTATTSRYHEAIACGIFPFVWKNYDKKNTIVASDWQRVESVDELYEKLPEVESRFKSVRQHYLQNVLKSRDWYFKKFERRLLSLIKAEVSSSKTGVARMSEIVAITKNELTSQELHDVLSEIAEGMRGMVNSHIEVAKIIARHSSKTYWSQVENELTVRAKWFDPSVLSMFRKIGNHPVIVNAGNRDRLPLAYNTLYQLADCDSDRLQKALDKGTIGLNTTLAQAKEFRSRDAKVATVRPKTVEPLTVTVKIVFKDKRGKSRLAKQAISELKLALSETDAKVTVSDF